MSAEVLADDDRRADAAADGDTDKNAGQRIGRADRGQCSFSYIMSHNSRVYNGVCLLKQISDDHRKRKGKQCPGGLLCDQIVFIFVHDFLEAPLRLQDAANSQSQFSWSQCVFFGF